MNEFDKLPMQQFDCEFCSMFFYYLSDYVAHKDLKHPIQQALREMGKVQKKIDSY